MMTLRLCYGRCLYVLFDVVCGRIPHRRGHVSSEAVLFDESTCLPQEHYRDSRKDERLARAWNQQLICFQSSLCLTVRRKGKPYSGNTHVTHVHDEHLTVILSFPRFAFYMKYIELLSSSVKLTLDSGHLVVLPFIGWSFTSPYTAHTLPMCPGVALTSTVVMSPLCWSL